MSFISSNDLLKTLQPATCANNFFAWLTWCDSKADS